MDEAHLASLPDQPGVYVFVDARGRTLYVGKARSLRKRVRQYFTEHTSDTRFLVHQIRTRATAVRTFATAGDREALLLENSLIKELRPRYNVRLKDDKSYLCIRVDLRKRWPRLELVRRPEPDGSRTFGPYHSARSARELKRFLDRRFMLRVCKDTSFAARKRPCLQHEMGRCLAPCTLAVDHDPYMQNVRQAVLYLEGRVDDLVDLLEEQMRSLSASMQYEKAAEVRDRLEAVRHAREKQRVVAVTGIDQDALAVARSDERATLAVLFFRRGVLTGLHELKVAVTALADEDILASFVGQYYAKDHAIPDEILLPVALPEADIIEPALAHERGSKVALLVPRRGHRRDLVDLAMENARGLLARWDRMEDPSTERLARLQAKLGLPMVPERIECMDISHTAGAQTVGSMAVMIDGKPEPSFYRRFRVRADTGGDDYAAMREVLERRFDRARGGQPGWEPPDLLVLDGGRGHLRMAEEVLVELGIGDVALASIAKDRRRAEAAALHRKVRARLAGQDEPDKPEDQAGYDTVFLPGQKNGLPVRGPASDLFLIARLRDEAHRFALGYHRKLRSKKTFESALTGIRGVGPATARKLLAAFGSVSAVREATADEMASRAGVPPSTAHRVAQGLGALAPDEPDKA